MKSNNLMSLKPMAVAAAAAVLLAACASPGNIAPQAKLKTPGDVGLNVEAARAAGDTKFVAPVPADWWKAFHDPGLDALVDQALAASPSPKLAEARVQAAMAAVAGVQGNDLPTLTGDAAVNRQHFTANGLYPPPIGGSNITSGNAQLTLSWDLDFFGRNRAQLAAALGSQRAAEAEAAASRLALAANVSRTYFQLGRLFEQRQVAERTLSQREQLLALTKDRVGAGLDTNVELRQGEGSIPDARLQIETLDEQIALSRHALAALTAQGANAFDTLTVQLQPAQAVVLPPSLPAELLGQRPDVAAARWRVEAASENVALARTQFYPNVNLTAFAGFQSFGLGKLFESSSRNLSVGPAISLPIFDAGRLRANLRGRAADTDAAVESYNQTVLDAVHDAADQISSLQSIARQQREQSDAERAAESAYDLAIQRYRAGLGTYLVVLSAESTVLTQRRAAADLKARALDGQVLLARSLGGGYVPATLPPATPVASSR